MSVYRCLIDFLSKFFFAIRCSLLSRKEYSGEPLLKINSSCRVNLHLYHQIFVVRSNSQENISSFNNLAIQNGEFSLKSFAISMT